MKYNANGMRTQKTDNNGTTNYYYDSQNNLIALVKGNDTLFFYYDSDNSVTSASFGGNMYYYIKNLQGDITRLIDENGSVVASYVYNDRGKILSTTGSSAITMLNPFRYRGYVYDAETGLYYLQSRYYDPVTGRFINADDTAFIDATGTVLSNNLFTYCENDAINLNDTSGTAVSKFIGFGVQLSLTASIGFVTFGVGLEIVWFTSSQVNTHGQSRLIPYIFAYGESVISVTSLKNTIKRIISKIKKNPTQLLSKPSFSAAVSFFAIWGYSNFKKPSDYSGKFSTAGGGIFGFKAYTSWPNKCFVVGVGKYWGVSGKGISVSKSYYIQLTGYGNIFSGLYGTAKKKSR